MGNIIMRITLFVIIIFLTAQSAISKENNENESLTKIKSDSEIKKINEQLKTDDPNEVLKILEPYENYSEWVVRHTVHFYLIRLVNSHPSNSKIRQEVTKRFVEAEFNESDRGSYKLMNNTEKDFNDESKNLIRKVLNNANKQYVGGDPSVLLCGIANIQEELPRLKDLLINELDNEPNKNKAMGTKWYQTTGWAARLARARMGVKEDIEKCVKLIESEIDNNNNFIILKDLGYIRRPEAIESLKKYFLSDKRLPPTNTNEPGEGYSYYIMDFLIDSLENIPVQKKPGRGYSQEQIDTVKKWISEQKTWKIIR
jgi:hypothetical protein